MSEVKHYTDHIMDWLSVNPGWHRARDVARGVGGTNNQTAVALYHLEKRNVVDRERVTPERGMAYSLWTVHEAHTDQEEA